MGVGRRAPFAGTNPGVGGAVPKRGPTLARAPRVLFAGRVGRVAGRPPTENVSGPGPERAVRAATGVRACEKWTGRKRPAGAAADAGGGPGPPPEDAGPDGPLGPPRRGRRPIGAWSGQE